MSFFRRSYSTYTVLCHGEIPSLSTVPVSRPNNCNATQSYLTIVVLGANYVTAMLRSRTLPLYSCLGASYSTVCRLQTQVDCTQKSLGKITCLTRALDSNTLRSTWINTNAGPASRFASIDVDFGWGTSAYLLEVLCRVSVHVAGLQIAFAVRYIDVK